jgi:hypothetical protein
MKKRNIVKVITKDTPIGAAQKLRLRFRVRAVMEASTHAYVGEAGNRSFSDVAQCKVWLVPVPDAIENLAAAVGNITGEIEIRNLTSEAAKLFKVDGEYLIDIVKA